MSTYSPQKVLQLEDIEGFARIRVDDFNTAELLVDVILQLKLISLKLDCLQANDAALDVNDLDDVEIR